MTDIATILTSPLDKTASCGILYALMIWWLCLCVFLLVTLGFTFFTIPRTAFLFKRTLIISIFQVVFGYIYARIIYSLCVRA